MAGALHFATSYVAHISDYHTDGFIRQGLRAKAGRVAVHASRTQALAWKLLSGRHRRACNPADFCDCSTAVSDWLAERSTVSRDTVNCAAGSPRHRRTAGIQT